GPLAIAEEPVSTVCWARSDRPAVRATAFGVAGAAGSVVGAELLAIRRVVHPVGVVLGRVLDLVLRALHVDGGLVEVDRVDDPRGEEHLLPEDPRAGVDDDVPRADVVARLVDLAHRAVEGLDGEADKIDAGPGDVRVLPDVEGAHYLPPSSLELPLPAALVLAPHGRASPEASWTAAARSRTSLPDPGADASWVAT